MGKISYKKEFEAFKSKMKSFTNEHTKFKIGDRISFKCGYHMKLNFETEILGFDTDGYIYVDWDCYWSPIHKNEKRKIKIINQ